MDLDRYFSREIIQRGYRYYNSGRVKYLVKHGSKLYGVVQGNFDYSAKIDLDSMEIRCNCPYEGRCKHAVALLLAYEHGEFLDGEAVKEALRNMGKDALVDLLFETAIRDYKLLKQLSNMGKRDASTRKKEGGVVSEFYDGLFRDIDTYHFPGRFIDAASSVSCSNKATILDFLKKVVKHQDEIVGVYPDDYYDQYMYPEDIPSEEDFYSAFEEIVEAFLSQNPSDKEWEDYCRLHRKMDYDFLSFDSLVLKYHDNVPERYAKIILSNHGYVEYLTKLGKTKEALRVCEDKVQKFTLLKSIDPGKAMDFGLKDLVPEHANKVAEYMLELGRKKEDVLKMILKDDDPSYELLLKLEDAVLEKKYWVLDLLLRKKLYTTYYQLCTRFEDDEALKRLTDDEIELEEDLSLSVGKRLIKSHPEDAAKILKKSVLRIARKAYSGYIQDVVERYMLMREHDETRAQELYDELAEEYPTRTKLKHELKKILM